MTPLLIVQTVPSSTVWSSTSAVGEATWQFSLNLCINSLVARMALSVRCNMYHMYFAKKL